MDYNLGKFEINIELLQKIIKSNILLYCVVLLVILKILTFAVSVNFPHNVFFADITRTALESLANETRRSAGLQPLIENAKLDQAAEMKAKNMVANNYFEHTSPSGITPWFWFSKAGYDYKYAGENLAIGFFDSTEVYNAWLNSPLHKANLLNPNYKEVGTAVLKGFGQNNAVVVVQLFGSQKALLVPVKPEKTINSLNVNNTEINVKKPVLGQMVLSQSIEQKNTFYDYEQILQDIIYGVSLVVIGILFVLIIFNAKISSKKELAFRSILIVILLLSAVLVNKGMVISIIPHQIII